MGLYQIKVLHSDRKQQQNEKVTYWGGEDVCKLYICKGLIFKRYKELTWLNIKEEEKKKQSNWKMSRGPE